jgi:hypothetical protein
VEGSGCGLTEALSGRNGENHENLSLDGCVVPRFNQGPPKYNSRALELFKTLFSEPCFKLNNKPLLKMKVPMDCIVKQFLHDSKICYMT